MFKGHSCCQCDRQNLFLVLHGTWFYTSGYGWWRCEWVTKTYIHYFVRSSQQRLVLTPDASDIPKDVSVTEKQPIAKTHASASGFSGEQCPVDEQPKTEDLVRLSEESPSTCHTPSISGLTSDQGMELNYIDKVPNFILGVLVACFKKLFRIFWPI